MFMIIIDVLNIMLVGFVVCIALYCYYAINIKINISIYTPAFHPL